MKKIERLELENQVLRNIIACVREELEIKRDRCETCGRISSIIDFEGKMEFALSIGEAVDYRCNKEKEPV